ncbi:MAG TPA: type II secretion system F family protein [Gammaproteobacteria bacterium]|nr:type II secretion system F family protein [Gammaproteobacteria bacterium]
MPAYRYKGRTTRGEAVTGVLDSESAEALANRLFERGITPVEIQEAVGSQDVIGDLWRRFGGARPKLTDLILFSRQMHAITKAGLPLLAGMKSLAASTPNTALRTALEAVIESLQTGRDLASSLARSPGIFSKFYISVVRVGEASGTLETAFLRLYEYLGMEQRIREKVKAALRYPATVVVAISVAITIITFWVLPRFAPIFAALGNHLPWATRVLLGVSGFGAHYWYLVVAGVTAAVVGCRLYVRDGDGRYRWDKLKLRLPVIGGIVHRAMLARLCRSFALTLEAGVPMIQSLSMIARAIGNEYLTERVLALRDGIERGEGLQHTAQTAQLFTPLALQMVGVGEETGTLGEMLDEVADFYEREVDHDLERLNATLEPMLIVAVGVMVLILALGVFLPMWDLAATAGSLG